jgi:hypothetical protein
VTKHITPAPPRMNKNKAKGFIDARILVPARSIAIEKI